MDIEHLTKSQLVMLTLLISFVTSMASGIVAVALMEKAPPTFAQTINHVVEHTIERVQKVTLPAIVAAPLPPQLIVSTTTITITQKDLVARVMAGVTPALVRMYDHDQQNPSLLGSGILTAPATLAADASMLGDTADIVGVLSDGTSVRFFVTKRDVQTGIAYLTASSTQTIAWRPAAVATSSSQLGADVVAVAGKSNVRVQSGIIASLLAGAKAPLIESTAPGSFLFTIDGSLIGISTEISRIQSASDFVEVSNSK